MRTSLCSCSASLTFRLFPLVVITLVSNFSEVTLLEKCLFYFDHVFHDYSRLHFLCFCFGYFLVEVQSFQCFYLYLVCCYYFEFHFCFSLLNDCLFLVSCFLSLIQTKLRSFFYLRFYLC